MNELAGEHGLLVMFICRHCPFFQHIQEELAALGRDYQAKGVTIVAISSNDASTHPDDGPSSLREQATEQDFTFPYLYDETQEVAKAHQAVCTPEFFLFDKNLALVYRGSWTTAARTWRPRYWPRLEARTGRFARRQTHHPGAEAQPRMQYQVEVVGFDVPLEKLKAQVRSGRRDRPAGALAASDTSDRCPEWEDH